MSNSCPNSFSIDAKVGVNSHRSVPPSVSQLHPRQTVTRTPRTSIRAFLTHWVVVTFPKRLGTIRRSPTSFPEVSFFLSACCWCTDIRVRNSRNRQWHRLNRLRKRLCRLKTLYRCFRSVCHGHTEPYFSYLIRGGGIVLPTMRSSLFSFIFATVLSLRMIFRNNLYIC